MVFLTTCGIISTEFELNQHALSQQATSWQIEMSLWTTEKHLVLNERNKRNNISEKLREKGNSINDVKESRFLRWEFQSRKTCKSNPRSFLTRRARVKQFLLPRIKTLSWNNLDFRRLATFDSTRVARRERAPDKIAKNGPIYPRSLNLPRDDDDDDDGCRWYWNATLEEQQFFSKRESTRGSFRWN